MTPEAAFLLSFARGHVDPRPPHDPAEPARVLRLFERHQVAALCHWRVERTLRDQDRASIESWPELRQGLRLAYRHQLVANDALRAQLQQLARSLEAAGVRSLVLKGPWLAFSAYPDPATRPLGDLDLCIREDDYLRALDAMRRAGYEVRGPAPPTAAEAMRQSHYGAQIRFAAPGRAMVELHFRLVNVGHPSADEEWVWRTARALESCSILVPGPEAMLLHLLLHANQHAYSLLRLLEDIAWALRRDGAFLDWELMISRIESLKAARSCYHSLLLARELAGAEFPEAALTRLRPGAIGRRIFAMAWNVPAVRRLEVERPAQALEAPRFALLEIGDTREKLRYLRDVAREAGGVHVALRRLAGLLRPSRSQTQVDTRTRR